MSERPARLQPSDVTALSLPDIDAAAMPADLAAYFDKCESKLGFVPNVLVAHAFEALVRLPIKPCLKIELLNALFGVGAALGSGMGPLRIVRCRGAAMPPRAPTAGHPRRSAAVAGWPCRG